MYKHNNKPIKKKSLLELNNDFKEFQQVKNNFLEKHRKVFFFKVGKKFYLTYFPAKASSTRCSRSSE